jgi:hypothetical protein
MGGNSAAIGKTNQAATREAPSLAKAGRREEYRNPGVTGPSAAGNQDMQRLLRGNVIRAKLELGGPGDPLEREADAAAERCAIGTPCQARSAVSCNGCHHQLTSRKPKPGSAGVSAPAAAGLIPRSGGRPLEPALRAEMESSFGADFSAVRVHTGRAAAESAESIQALAYTAGSDVVFGAERYAPETGEGRKLLAHELAHVVQQRNPAGDATARKIQRVVHGDIRHISITQAWARDLTDIELETQVQIVRTQLSEPVSHTAEMEENTRSNLSVLEAEVTHRNLMPEDTRNRIREILDYWWVGPLNEYELEAIWNGFGDRLPVILRDPEYWELWQACISRGAELWDLSAVQPFKENFRNDVKRIALDYLADNRRYIIDELTRLGLMGDQPIDETERNQAIAEVQTAARIVSRAQQAQASLRSLQVGYEWEIYDAPARRTVARKVGAYFDPNYPPMMRPSGDEQPPLPRWEDVKRQYDRVTGIITGLVNRYPTIFALVQEGTVRQAAAENPQAALTAVDHALRAVLHNIDEAAPKIRSEDLDYRDLTPIHDQLRHNQVSAPSGINWSENFYQGVMQDVLSDHEATQFWIAMGLGSLAAAAFIVAEFATLGSATFFIAAGVGLGAGALQAGISWERYLDLAQAARTNLSGESALVSSGEASAALFSAVVDTVFVFLDAYGVAARGARAAGGAAESAARFAAREETLRASERAVAEEVARETAERESAEAMGRELAGPVEQRGVQEAGTAAAEASARGSRTLVERISQVIRDFYESVKSWARRVYQRFGFRAYEVVDEGEWIALYGIRSRTLLARFRKDSLETWIIDNSDDLRTARHSRASQLGRARSARLTGEDALANLLRQNAVELSEQIGEMSANAAITSRFGSATLIHQGSGSGTLDLIYRLSDNTIIVVEAKGGGGRIISREIRPGVRAEQGTVGYLRSILEEMSNRPAEAAVADEVLAALNERKLRYFLSETPIPAGTASLETDLSEFIVPALP